MSISAVQARAGVPAPLQLLLLQVFNLAIQNITNSTVGSQRGLIPALLDTNATNHAQLIAIESLLDKKSEEQNNVIEKHLNILDKRIVEQDALFSKRINNFKEFVERKLQEGNDLIEKRSQKHDEFVANIVKNYNEILEKKLEGQKSFLEKRFDEQDKKLGDQDRYLNKKFVDYNDFLQKKLQEQNSFMEEKLKYHTSEQRETGHKILDQLDKMEDCQGKNCYGKDSLSGFRKELAALSKSERERRLLEASKSGNVTLVRGLLQVGTDLSVTDGNTRTPLHLAADYQNAGVVRVLLDNGAPVDGRAAKWNATAMHYGCDSPDVLYLLLDRGAPLEPRTVSGDTPLHWAAWNNRLEGAQALVSKGANTQAKTNGGETPLDVAKRKGNQALVDFLSQVQQ
ncbi:uncharacterized protein [Periplaneta americana]|uniref:uncharacterized protein isoform X3 n=1 Tax=Periplaneta americana TaxID=6978 RepID=UPI0037E88F55